LLGSILQRAVGGGRLARNPVRLVRRIARPRRREVKPLAPVSVEAMRAASNARNATRSPLAIRMSVKMVRSGRPGETALVFPGPRGGLWTKTTYDNWRTRAFNRACTAAQVAGATRYGYVMDELDDAPRLGAEEAIRAARESACACDVHAGGASAS
jgi:hypothetical protein